VSLQPRHRGAGSILFQEEIAAGVRVGPELTCLHPVDRTGGHDLLETTRQMLEVERRLGKPI